MCSHEKRYIGKNRQPGLTKPITGLHLLVHGWPCWKTAQTDTQTCRQTDRLPVFPYLDKRWYKLKGGLGTTSPGHGRLGNQLWGPESRSSGRTSSPGQQGLVGCTGEGLLSCQLEAPFFPFLEEGLLCGSLPHVHIELGAGGSGLRSQRIRSAQA